ncbi:hypothetical protein Tco_0706990 [Tanacetum coccineum]|uniref:Uncharacterized protein n=1 Tax=Tanacetum coccineum TaxID=301880 RepID=A0ABQ4Y8Y5_9ASTR
MDDPNITMKEYIRIEEEKAQKHGRTFNWQTATYGKVKYCEDEDDCFTNFVTEFLAIVFDDTLTSDATLSCEPTVSLLNEKEIDFKISFDESDDEDYMPTVSYSDDLDYFKNFETEFPAIVYDDALTSKLDSLTEHAVSHHHIDKLDLKNETSLSEYDEEEQNILYFNDLFSLNVIYPNDLKSDKDNDDDELDIIRSSGGRLKDRGPLVQDVYILRVLQHLLNGVVPRLVFILAVGFHTSDERWAKMDDEGFEAVTAGRIACCRVGIKVRELGCQESGARLSEGHFIGRLAAHFGLVSDEGLRGLSMITPPGPERQQVAAAGAPKATKDAFADDEGALAVPAPVQAAQLPPVARTISQRLARLEGDVHGI